MTHAAPALLAALAGEDAPRYTYENLKPGTGALVVTVALVVAFFFLVRSLRRQLRKVDYDDTATTDAARAASREPGEPRTERQD